MIWILPSQKVCRKTFGNKKKIWQRQQNGSYLKNIVCSIFLLKYPFWEYCYGDWRTPVKEWNFRTGDKCVREELNDKS